MSILWPIMLALGLWWLTTLLLLWRLRLPQQTFRSTLFVVSVACGFAIVGVKISLDQQTVFSAFIAFASGLAFWCWHEALYFLGYVSGPRALACPQDVTTWQRFCFGVKASLYHELGVILHALVLIWICWDAPNPLAAQTFVVFWLMRWSSKMNIFFGVKNLHEEFWPKHLKYLSSYVASDRGNRFYPVSIVIASLLYFWITSFYGAVGATEFSSTASALVLTMLALACLEHLFLLVRVPDHLLWQWGVSTVQPKPGASALVVPLVEELPVTESEK